LRQGQNISLSVASTPSIDPTQPLAQLVPVAVCSRIKQQGRETGYSFAANTEVKNSGATFTPSTRLHGVLLNELIKRRDNLILVKYVALFSY
jgi:hypothetical protein